MAAIDWTDFLVDWLRWSQGHVVEALAATDPASVRQRPSARAPSVAFHAWHLARWADRHQAAFPSWLGRDDGRTATEIWVDRGLAERWGLADRDLGDYGIGAGLDDEASAALPLPEAAELLEYVRAAFTALEAVVATLGPEDLAHEVIDLYDDRSNLGEVVAQVISHTDRHLGMMEAIRGVLGERGTATV